MNEEIVAKLLMLSGSSLSLIRDVESFLVTCGMDGPLRRQCTETILGFDELAKEIMRTQDTVSVTSAGSSMSTSTYLEFLGSDLLKREEVLIDLKEVVETELATPCFPE